MTNLSRTLSSFLSGSQHVVDMQLHKRYGKFVRDGPNSLFISDIDVYKAVYGFTNIVEKGDFYALMSPAKKIPGIRRFFCSGWGTTSRSKAKVGIYSCTG